MPSGQTLPDLWLLSDARNAARLEQALASLPEGSGFVFRHYHLEGNARREAFAALAAEARRHGHRVVLSGTGAQASEWGADGIYAPADRLGPRGRLLRLATAHGAAELDLAASAGADAAFLSPVFPTRSHACAGTLGKEEFLSLAREAALPVIALGGMDRQRARELGWRRWGAIDGLALPHRP